MELLDLDRRYVWHPYTPLNFESERALLVSAQGAYVTDVAGRRYLDATASWWCQLHGHCHPRLAAALSKQAQTLDQVLFAPHTHPTATLLAKALIEKLGPAFTKIFYSDNGSTAVETALKLSLQYWSNLGVKGRNKFLSMEGAYHGDTLGAVSVSGVGTFHDCFDGALKGSFKVPMPRPCTSLRGARHAALAAGSGDEATLSHLEQWQREVVTILDAHSKELAAVIIEPLVLGASGMIIYPKEYVEALVRLCFERGILVIFDEVFTGFGRTGKFWAKDHLSCEPDMICLSKGLTSGMMPLAVTGVNQKITDVFTGKGTFYHGHTFTANALGCSVALESLKIFDDENVLQRNEELIQLMASQAQRFLALPHVGDVRHLGMIWAAELVADKATRQIFQPPNGPGWKIANALWRKGIWIRPLNNIVYIIPPYCVSLAELSFLFDSLFEEIRNESHYEGF